MTDSKAKNLQKRETGVLGEEYISTLLENQGYEILARNFLALPYGELDIVAKKDAYLVFVEVKTRTEGGMLPPFSAVTKAKQKKIVAASFRFLQEYPDLGLQPRFDIAEVIVSKADAKQIVGHRLFENAFSPQEEYHYF